MDMLEKLNLYLENTPHDEIMKAFEKVERFNNVGIPMENLVEKWNRECVQCGKIPIIESEMLAEKLEPNRNSELFGVFF